jgi:hypothetical protein
VAFFVHNPSGMRLEKIFGLLALAVLAPSATLLSFAGCSSSGASTFADLDAAPESAPAEDSSFFATDGGDASADAPTTCTPALPAGFTSTWKPPAVDLTACKAADLTAYATACLGQPYDPTACNTYKAANAKCAQCVESDATGAQLAPVLWHLSRTYYTLNIAGCIALEAKDQTGTGCAAAYQAVIACKELSCDSCFSIKSPSFATFAACEKNAGTGVCNSYGIAESTKCADVKDAAAPTSACFPAATDTTLDLFKKIAPLFCGG